MLKNALKIENVVVLTKKQQATVNGGLKATISSGDDGWCVDACQTNSDCPTDLGGNPGRCRTITCDSAPTKTCH